MFNLGCRSEWHWNITSQMRALFTLCFEVHTVPVAVIARRQKEARENTLNLFIYLFSLLRSVLFIISEWLLFKGITRR